MERPDFAIPVAGNGYAWWYVDAVSDDGRQALTVIAFVGSVFSPYYYRARQRGTADPENHCAINVALYGPRAARWAMTERPAAAVRREARRFAVGPSALTWVDGKLQIDVCERGAPSGRRLAGRIRLLPGVVNDEIFTLDAGGRHRWQPLAPRARVELEFERPALCWQGGAYFDTNDGDEPLEDGFTSWNWSRSQSRECTALTYDVIGRDGRERPLAIEFDPGGALRRTLPGPRRRLRRSGWGVARAIRSERAARIHETLEDTPFYARSTLALGDPAAPQLAVHESLSLSRFRAPWVRLLLPFRMPRNRWTRLPAG